MSEIQAVQCQSCGGSVAAKPGVRIPKCLFCGADALVDIDTPEGIESPVAFLPFVVASDAANEHFATFAGSSFWYPNDLRNAKLELQKLQLPAWAWSGSLESHWTGLAKGRSASGKRPVGGAETLVFTQVLVPASQSLRQAELSALGAYNEEDMTPVSEDGLDAPRELSEVTRSVARQKAQGEMRLRHQRALKKKHSPLSLQLASVVSDLDGKPVLVPVWIGAYRYGDKVYRFLVNGQTGTFIGDAPTSWWKVAGVALAVMAAIGVIFLLFMVCAGGGAVVMR